MGLFVTIDPANAVFSATTGNPSDSWSAPTLQPPTGLGLSSTCPGGTVTASWTATSSTFATGYTLVRKSGGTVQNTISVAGRTTTSRADTNVPNGTYTYELNAVSGSWTSSVASAGTTVSCAPPQPTNGSFESGLTGWTCSGGTDTIVTTPVHAGSQAVDVNWSSGGNPKCQQLITGLSPSTAYTWHIWMYGSGTPFVFYSPDGTSTSGSGSSGTAGTWKESTVSFTTGAGVTQMYVGFGLFSTGTYTFDDMSLTQP